MSSFVNTYIPSFLVVCVSYMSFWLDIEAIPGRVTLCVTAFLTIATQMVSARNALPSVNYLTALDVWLFGCLILVFTAMIEFTIAHAISRYFKSTKIKEIASPITKTSVDYSQVNSRFELLSNLSERRREFMTLKQTNPRKLSPQIDFNLDKMARVCYPIIAISLVVIYWTYYLRFNNHI